MFKKEYFLLFAVIGLAIAYGFFSLLVFVTRGKKGNLLAKKIALGAMIIAFTAVLNTGTFAQTQDTPTPTPVYGTLEPTPFETPDPNLDYSTPEVTLEPLPEYGTPQMGDVNMDSKVDIIDALLIAQVYVALYATPHYNPDYADVNGDDRIDILDALLVAQKYVGLIDEFPDNTPSEEE
jgi:hypothetical protein